MRYSLKFDPYALLPDTFQLHMARHKECGIRRGLRILARHNRLPSPVQPDTASYLAFGIFVSKSNTFGGHAEF